MRRIQGTPIIFSMDIKEAFFRILLHEDSVNSLLFLMDYDSQTNQLTAKQGPNTKLVTIRCLVTVMGILQSPCFLGLCREDLEKDITDKMLTYFLKYFSYLDEQKSRAKSCQPCNKVSILKKTPKCQCAKTQDVALPTVWNT